MREMWDGHVWAARPMTVVRDDPDVIALYMAIGTPWKRPVAPDGSVLRMPWREWTLADDVWRRRSFLHLVGPGEAHAAMVAFDEEGRFAGWYINLQEPLRRTAVGFDYMDQMLDVEVEPDLSWRMKDEAELQEEVDRGLISAAQAGEVRAEARRVIDRIERRAAPFADGWDRWRPDPAWVIPRFTPGWDRGARTPLEGRDVRITRR
jgi:predicted RNA-binding protein associated with RNAse of E/G family